jgi:hypothetical protein
MTGRVLARPDGAGGHQGASRPDEAGEDGRGGPESNDIQDRAAAESFWAIWRTCDPIPLK